VGKSRDWTDDHTLLCESCGYVLESLATSGACPECGRPIATSLPEVRSGTAWQRGRSPGAWASTAWGVLMAPRRVFGVMDAGKPGAPTLISVNLLLAGLFMAIMPTARLLAGRDPVVAWAPKSGVLAGDARHWMTFLISLSIVLVTFVGLWTLTWIEIAGVRFFHTRRGWRITRRLAWNVCAHATVGWVVSGALIALGWGLIDLDIMLTSSARPVTVRSRVGDWMALPPVLGFFVGMMIFEYRVYQGVRACRFANSKRSGPKGAPAMGRA
jgi:predicted RNA-binding Zn-ribbon protein involved in translation (DUF1610 family)